MIKKFINKTVCLASGHKLIEAGSCPYTQINYKACSRCNLLFDSLKVGNLK